MTMNFVSLTPADAMGAMNQTKTDVVATTNGLFQIEWDNETSATYNNSTTKKSSPVPHKPTLEELYEYFYEYYYNANDIKNVPPLLILILITVVLNLGLIVVIASEKRLHKPANAYIFAMACVDVLDGSIPMVGYMQETGLRKWKLNVVFCHLVALFDQAIPITGTSIVFLMAFDRYSAIMYPLQYTKPNRKVTISIQIGLAYALPILFWLMILLVFRNSIMHGSCFMTVPGAYSIAQIIADYFISFIATIYCYGRCVWGLWSQYFKVKPHSVDGTDKRKNGPLAGNNKVSVVNTLSQLNEETSVATQGTIVSVSLSVTDGSEQSTDKLTPVGSSNAARPPQPPVDRNPPRVQPDQSNKRRQDLMRSMRNVGAYAGAFTILVMPYAVVTLVNNVCNVVRVDYRDCIDTSRGAGLIIGWLPYCHSPVHPMLFAMTQRDFRLAVKKQCRKFYRFVCRCRNPK